MTRLFWIVLALLVWASPSLAEETFVEVAPAVRLRVIDEGPRNGMPPLVLVTGWRVTADVWRGQIDTFKGERRVVAFDPRSQGRSTITAEGDTPEQRARDLHALLATLGLHDVVLVGWSQGVQDVASYIDQFGSGDLKAVVLVDSSVSGGAASIAANPELAAGRVGGLSLYSQHPREFTAGMLHAIMRKPMPEARFDHILDEALKTPTAIGSAMWFADLYGVDRSKALERLNAPTLVIASALSDELAAQRAGAERLAKGRFLAIEDAGHAVFVDQPERFNDALRSFIQSVS